MLSLEKVMSFLEVAEALANRTKNPKRPVGAVILSPKGSIVSTGHNDLAGGIPHTDANYTRYNKDFLMAHAEENAICQAAEMGATTGGSSMLITGLPPCHICARLISRAGIIAVYCPHYAIGSEPKWDTSFSFARKILEAKGVKYVEY